MSDPIDPNQNSNIAGSDVGTPPGKKQWSAWVLLALVAALVYYFFIQVPPTLTDGWFRIDDQYCLTGTPPPNALFKVDDEINFHSWAMRDEDGPLHANQLSDKKEINGVKYALHTSNQGQSTHCLYMKKKPPILSADSADQQYFLMVKHGAKCVEGNPITNEQADLIIGPPTDCSTQHDGAWQGGP